MGFQNAEPFGRVAPHFPETSFAIINMVVELPYVLTVVLMAGFIGDATLPEAGGVAYVKER